MRYFQKSDLLASKVIFFIKHNNNTQNPCLSHMRDSQKSNLLTSKVRSFIKNCKIMKNTIKVVTPYDESKPPEIIFTTFINFPVRTVSEFLRVKELVCMLINAVDTARKVLGAAGSKIYNLGRCKLNLCVLKKT